MNEVDVLTDNSDNTVLSQLMVANQQLAANEQQLRASNKQLQKSEEQYRILVEGTESFVTRVDNKGKFVFVNQTSEKIFGLKPEECIGLLAFDFVHPDDRQRTMDAFDGWIRDRTENITIENRQVSRTGEVYDMLWTCRLVFDESGQVVRIDSIAQDITERKKAEERLRHFQKAVDSSSDAIGMSTPDGKHYYQNQAFTELVGMAVEETDGLSGPPSTVYVDEQLGQDVFKTIMKGDSWDGEVEMIAKNGRKLDVLLRAYSIKDQAGKVIGLVGVHTDITERKRAEEEMERIFNMTNYMVCVASLDGYFTRVNVSFEHILGHSSKELLSKPFFDFIHPDDIEKTKAVVEEKLSSGVKVIAFENRYRCKDGSYKWFSWTSHPVPEQNITYAIAYDITERKQAEEALRESEKKYRTLFEQSADATLIIERDKFIDCNQATVEMLGYATKQELLRAHPSRLSPEFQPDGRSSFEKANEMMAIAFKQGSHRFEWNHKRQNGEVFPVEVLLTAISLRDRNFLHVVWRDITERKQAEEEGKRLIMAINQAREIFIITDINGTIQYVNPAFEHITGYTCDEVIGQNPRILKSGRHDDSFYKDMWDTLIRGETWNDEIINKKKDGAIYTEEATITPVRNSEGKMINYVGVKHDISDRKRAEVERERLFKILEFKNRELQDIVYSASHDLRSPLVNIEGFSSILKTDCAQLMELLADKDAARDKTGQIVALLSEDIPESLGFITGSTKKMASLLDGLLQVSRVGSVEINSGSLDMNNLTQGVLTAMEHQIQESCVSVTLESLPGCIGDVHMLDHVLTNLVGNAVKYLDPARKGQIRISGKVEGSMSVYCVQDNGIGIAPSHQAKVFEIFHRLDPEGSAGGEGLGLTIVTRIVDRLGGRVWVESEPEKGSKFFFSLLAVK